MWDSNFKSTKDPSFLFYALPGIAQPSFRESSDSEASGRKEMKKPLLKAVENDMQGQTAENAFRRVLEKFSFNTKTSLFVIQGA